MPVSGAPQTGHQSHTEQVSPETDGLIHISGGHCQVINTVEFDHGDASLACLSLTLSENGRLYNKVRVCQNVNGWKRIKGTAMESLRYEILHGLSLILLFVIIVLLSKMINDLLTPYKVDEELTGRDNVALSTSIAGYLSATTIIYVGALLGPSQSILQDLLAVGGYSILGIILLNASRLVNDRLILYKFSNVKEIIADRNIGTGAVQSGSYIASGLIVAGAIHGDGGGLLTALAFFALGQIALIIFTWVYNLITPFDIHEEIENDNVAAGLAFGGSLVAVGIILMKGAAGNFISWKHNLSIFGMDALLVFILFPAVRFFFDKVIISGTALNHEIQYDRNAGAGLLEMMVAISFAVILFFTME